MYLSVDVDRRRGAQDLLSSMDDQLQLPSYASHASGPDTPVGGVDGGERSRARGSSSMQQGEAAAIGGRPMQTECTNNAAAV